MSIHIEKHIASRIQSYSVLLLVGGLEHGFYDFPYIGNVIVPTDELILFRGVQTTNQLKMEVVRWKSTINTINGGLLLRIIR